MKGRMDRRSFLASGSAMVFAGMTSRAAATANLQRSAEVTRVGGTALQVGLNAYSFNAPLSAGTMTLEDLVDYCAREAFVGLDATGYYFPGYPVVPADEYVHALKRHAYINGVNLYGTGVRNDFSTPDEKKRRADVQLVKQWIDIAEKLGAGTIRIFTGPGIPQGHTFDQVLEWMAPAIRECAAYGRDHGVIVAVQNHNGFLRTADQTIQVVETVGSEWCGVMLDVGSLRTGDPYQEIDRLVPYAVSWQLKENVGYGEREEPIDLQRIRASIEKHGYRGYLSLETLGSGDPKVKVDRFLRKVRAVFR
jgi:sugar phosphate isomerase/epimerase